MRWAMIDKQSKGCCTETRWSDSNTFLVDCDDSNCVINDWYECGCHKNSMSHFEGTKDSKKLEVRPSRRHIWMMLTLILVFMVLKVLPSELPWPLPISNGKREFPPWRRFPDPAGKSPATARGGTLQHPWIQPPCWTAWQPWPLPRWKPRWRRRWIPSPAAAGRQLPPGSS